MHSDTFHFFRIIALPLKFHFQHQYEKKANKDMQKLVGSLNWLGQRTRPDLATITKILAQHIHHTTSHHVNAAKHVLRYPNGTRDLGIQFSRNPNKIMDAYVKFPVDPTSWLNKCDANWGLQDQSKPRKTEPPTAIFKSRSLLGFLIWLDGPLHWISKW